MKKRFLQIAFMALILLSVSTLSAQPGGGGGGQGNGGPPPGSTGAPVDGGIAILLISVAAYANKRLAGNGTFSE